MLHIRLPLKTYRCYGQLTNGHREVGVLKTGYKVYFKNSGM